MSRHDELLEILKHCIKNGQGSGINAVVQLPLETALGIQSLLQKQHSALKHADAFVEEMKGNYDNTESVVRIDQEVIKMNEIIIKSALT